MDNEIDIIEDNNVEARFIVRFVALFARWLMNPWKSLSGLPCSVDRTALGGLDCLNYDSFDLTDSYDLIDKKNTGLDIEANNHINQKNHIKIIVQTRINHPLIINH